MAGFVSLQSVGEQFLAYPSPSSSLHSAAAMLDARQTTPAMTTSPPIHRMRLRLGIVFSLLCGMSNRGVAACRAPPPHSYLHVGRRAVPKNSMPERFSWLAL